VRDSFRHQFQTSECRRSVAIHLHICTGYSNKFTVRCVRAITAGIYALNHGEGPMLLP
jgi:hypothetical protein